MMNIRILVGVAALSMANLSLADSFIFGFSGSSDAKLKITYSDSTTFTSSTSWSPLSASSFNQGWWSAISGNSDGNTNTFAGTLSGIAYRNFFTFDIANLDRSKGIVGATLFADTYTVTDDGTYRLYDVSTNASTLNLNAGTNAAIFNDLGTGTMYGAYGVLASESGINKGFALNSAALAEIAASGPFFSVGGTWSEQPVPEPATLAALGLGAAAMLRRRKKA